MKHGIWTDEIQAMKIDIDKCRRLYRKARRKVDTRGRSRGRWNDKAGPGRLYRG